MAHTNGVESFWSMLKRGYHGVYHQMSIKHLQRYINEYAGRHGIRDLNTIDQRHGIRDLNTIDQRHGIRDLNTIDQVRDVVAGLVGRRLLYRDLTAKG